MNSEVREIVGHELEDNFFSPSCLYNEEPLITV
jgi:hypothetical protein